MFLYVNFKRAVTLSQVSISFWVRNFLQFLPFACLKHIQIFSQKSQQIFLRASVYERGKTAKICGEFLIKKSYKVKQHYWHAETYAMMLFTFKEGKKSSMNKKKFTRNIMNNKRDLPRQEKHTHWSDARSLGYFQFRNECKFLQIDICKLQRNERENWVFDKLDCRQT